MEKGLVSIIIPTFNRAKILYETLDSFLAQSYAQWECLVVDDGSTDGTQDVIKDYVQQDSRFQFLTRPIDRPKGANACRNFGFEQSTGEFINWFDSDDIAAPNFLSEKVSLLQNNNAIDMAACYGEVFFADHRPNHPVCPVDDYTDNEVENYILHDFCFYTNSPLWRKSYLLEKNEFFDEELHRGQEKDLHFRLVIKGIRYTRFKQYPLFFKRGDNESISTQAGSSLKAKKSVFNFREKQFAILNRIENPSKEKLVAYLFYRQAALYYDMVQSASPSEKKEIVKQYFPKLQQMLGRSHLSNRYTISINFGNLMLKTFGKGYKFFYFPQFDYRSF